jgi:hypothetical protein
MKIHEVLVEGYNSYKSYSQNPIKAGDTVQYKGQSCSVTAVEGSKYLLSNGKTVTYSEITKINKKE